MAREQILVERQGEFVVLRCGAMRLRFEPHHAQLLAQAINVTVSDIDIPKSVTIDAVIIDDRKAEPLT